MLIADLRMVFAINYKPIMSLYIHIPFCRKKCLYCDFCSIAYDELLAADYIDTLYGQIQGFKEHFSTIYIGGGTPTVLENNLLAQLLRGFTKLTRADTEFTVEANPESLNAKTIDILLSAGVNRLSIGCQSFNDDKLKKLGRIHSACVAYEAVAEAAKRGFKNISLDLMFGVWDEDIKTWKEDLKKAVSLPVKHISSYALTYEENTPLLALKEKKTIVPLENEVVAKMYEYAIEYLDAQGFKRYEISNFAKEGFSCRHNQNYWENNPYIGLGPSAVSYLDGVRKENISDVKEYILRAHSAKEYVVSSEKLTPVARAKETAALKIRAAEGIDLAWFKKKTGFDFLELEAEPLKDLVDSGLVICQQKDREIHRVYLSRQGFLFCDKVSSEFL